MSAYDLTFDFTPAKEMKVVPIEWQVQGLLESSSVTSLFGPPGVAKTFFALDVACCVASGRPFHGREVSGGAVFYVAGEGLNGIGRRIEVWSQQNEIRPERLYVSNKSLDLFHRDGARRLKDVIQSVAEETGETPQLIVIDTLARNFSGDENSAGDISRFISHLDEIRHRWGASVLIVHHSGKNLGRHSRGSTALPGAVDAEYEFARDKDEVIRVTSLKMKEADKPEPMSYVLIAAEATSSEGEIIHSAVLKPVALGSSEVRAPSGKNQRLALDVLHQIYAESAPGVDGAIVTKDSWNVRCQDAGLDPKRIREAMEGLIKNEFVAMDGDRVIISGSG